MAITLRSAFWAGVMAQKSMPKNTPYPAQYLEIKYREFLSQVVPPSDASPCPWCKNPPTISNEPVSWRDRRLTWRAKCERDECTTFSIARGYFWSRDDCVSAWNQKTSTGLTPIIRYRSANVPPETWVFTSRGVGKKDLSGKWYMLSGSWEPTDPPAWWAPIPQKNWP